jgi:hypothetical protein
MATAQLRSPNRCLVGGMVIVSFIILEAAVGGQALQVVVREAVQAQATMLNSHAGR